MNLGARKRSALGFKLSSSGCLLKFQLSDTVIVRQLCTEELYDGQCNYGTKVNEHKRGRNKCHKQFLLARFNQTIHRDTSINNDLKETVHL